MTKAQVAPQVAYLAKLWNEVSQAKAAGKTLEQAKEVLPRTQVFPEVASLADADFQMKNIHEHNIEALWSVASSRAGRLLSEISRAPPGHQHSRGSMAPKFRPSVQSWIGRRSVLRRDLERDLVSFNDRPLPFPLSPALELDLSGTGHHGSHQPSGLTAAPRRIRRRDIVPPLDFDERRVCVDSPTVSCTRVLGQAECNLGADTHVDGPAIVTRGQD
jgi:hypothetical protein